MYLFIVKLGQLTPKMAYQVYYQDDAQYREYSG